MSLYPKKKKEKKWSIPLRQCCYVGMPIYCKKKQCFDNFELFESIYKWKLIVDYKQMKLFTNENCQIKILCTHRS